jgi:hypothetical protein
MAHSTDQMVGQFLPVAMVRHGYADSMPLEEDHGDQRPEVDAEDLSRHDAAALRLANDLGPGESARWADLVNTAASMAEVEDQDQ